MEIPTIDGKVKVKIDSGTQPGKVLRLRGKGLPNVNGYGTGDLLVNISIYVPEALNKEEKSTLEKMEASRFLCLLKHYIVCILRGYNL